MASVKPMRKTALDQSKLNSIVDLLKSGGRGKIKMVPLSGIDKVVIEQSAPSDNPNAIAFVQSGSDDIHIVLPALEASLKKEMESKGLNYSDLGSLDLSNLDNNPKLDTIIIVLNAALQIFGHELGHLEGTKSGGELKSEPYAEQKGAEAMKSLKVNEASHSMVKLELQKLASQLSDLGEDSFVGDVLLISSMIKEEVVSSLPKKLSNRDLNILVTDLDRLFTK